MEVVSVGEDEEREEGEEKERVVKMAAVSSVYRGKDKVKRKMLKAHRYDQLLSLSFCPQCYQERDSEERKRLQQ